eukprot:3401731-Rhodomonas_salina.1
MFLEELSRKGVALALVTVPGYRVPGYPVGIPTRVPGTRVDLPACPGSLMPVMVKGAVYSSV